MGDKILKSDVFEIKQKHKATFAENAVKTLGVNDFKDFKLLFDNIESIIISC